MHCPTCHNPIDQPMKDCPYCHASLANLGIQDSKSSARKRLLGLSPRRLLLVWTVGLIGTCILSIILVNFFSDLHGKNEDKKISEYQVKMATYCEAAKMKLVNPGEVHNPVFGYLMKGNEYFGENSFMYLEYMRFERWIGDYGSINTPMYKARTVLCVDADDLTGEYCEYDVEGGGYLGFTQKQQNFHGYLIDMESGNLLGKKTFTGGNPGACDETMFVSANYGYEESYEGETVSDEEVLNWIKTLQTE